MAADHHHDHDHNHHPAHRHGGGHAHAAPSDFGRAFAIGAVLNVGFIVVEVVAGILANSTALLADAGHNLSDVFSLLMAWGAATLARRPTTARFTYGLRSSSILVALANAVLLLIAVGAIAWEALWRLVTPEPVAGETMMVVAGAGILINGATALMFMRGRNADLNIRGVFLHMTADAAVSLGVVIAGLAILLTGQTWLDPATSLVIAAVIVWGTWSLLRDSVNLALDAVPAGIDPAAVRDFLAGLPEVGSVHHLHIWAMSTTETALTCHLVVPGGHPGDAFLARAAIGLHDRFGIAHATLQIELGEHTECALERTASRC